MICIIRLPNGRTCGAGVYARAWRELLAMDPRAPVNGFDHFASPAGDVLRELRRGLHDRINRHDRGYGIGRRWAPEWQAQAVRDARRLQEIAQSVRVYQFETAEARGRFGHLLSRLDD